MHAHLCFGKLGSLLAKMASSSKAHGRLAWVVSPHPPSSRTKDVSGEPQAKPSIRISCSQTHACPIKSDAEFNPWPPKLNCPIQIHLLDDFCDTSTLYRRVLCGELKRRFQRGVSCRYHLQRRKPLLQSGIAKMLRLEEICFMRTLLP